MKSLFYKVMRSLKRGLWALMVAYMLGMHNMYKGEDKTLDNIIITTEVSQAQENGTPKV